MSETVCEVIAAIPRSKPKRGPRCGMNRPSSLTQAMDLQAIAMAAARDPNVPSHVKAAHMRAWVDLEEVRLRLKGYGAPKPVEARNATSKRKPRAPIAPIAHVQSSEPARDASRPTATPVSPPDAK